MKHGWAERNLVQSSKIATTFNFSEKCRRAVDFGLLPFDYS